jgi:hypothetical protein
MANNRAGIVDSVLDLVGQTPMVRMTRLCKNLGIDPSIEVCAKLEYFNAGIIQCTLGPLVYDFFSSILVEVLLNIA